MQRKVLSVLAVLLFIAAALSPLAMAADSDADTRVPKPYDDNAPKTLTFQGIAKHNGEFIPSDKLAGAHVVVMAAYMDSADSRLYYTTMPETGSVFSKDYVEENGINYDFTVSIPQIEKNPLLGPKFSYYLCIENGYKIAGVSSQLNGEPVKVYPYPYERNPEETAPWGTNRMPAYTAYMIDASLYSKPNPIFVTDSSLESKNIISLATAKSNVTGTVMSGKFALANVKVDLCNAEKPDTVEYSTYSDKSGDFVFYDVNTGTYIVRAETNGYSAEDTLFTVTDGEINTLDISMVQENTRYFGYDMPHFLLIIGGVIGIILITASLFFQYWVVRKKHDNWVYNDMNDKEE